MSSRQGFPYTTFTDSMGSPLSGGYVLIEISTDVQSPDSSMCRGMVTRVALDDSGVMISVPQVWSNMLLLPAGSFYLLSAYTADGELASGPTSIQV